MRFLSSAVVSIFFGTVALAQFEPPSMPVLPEAKPTVNPLKIYFGCIFVATTLNVDCAEVGKALREKNRLIEFVSKSESEVEIEFSEITDGAHEKYTIKITDHTDQVIPPTYIFESKRLKMRATLSQATKIDHIIPVIMSALVHIS